MPSMPSCEASLYPELFQDTGLLPREARMAPEAEHDGARLSTQPGPVAHPIVAGPCTLGEESNRGAPIPRALKYPEMISLEMHSARG